ncbi:MAG: riboflavin biosynthesis protein RibF [Planctomycetes bacterium]|nr:riboflavin biosynthesis protein RibF [Planctomycetota bacterium]
MRLIEGLDKLLALDLRAGDGDGEGDELASHSVVAVGVFDGVHLGHQRLLQQLRELSSALRGTPTVVTFANHPQQILRGESPPLIVSVPHRLRLLRRAGVQRLVLLDFDRRFREMTARDFAADVLHRSLRARGLLLGYDSALGRDREGTPQRFTELGAEFGFEVHTGTPFLVDGKVASSTEIRAAIARGDLDLAQRFLGRFPGALGDVVHGDDRGRSLGFPTANVAVQAAVMPPTGVYAVEAILDGVVHPAVANLGPKPTFAGVKAGGVGGGGGGGEVGLEVHLLDFEGDLYGRRMEVVFRRKLRDVARFADAAALCEQIGRDIAEARRCLLA